MPFIPGLLDQNEERPAWWKAFVIGVLNRAISYNQQSLFNDWCTAAGCSPLLYQAPNDANLNGVGVAGDGENIVTAFQGTRTLDQLLQQVYLSPQQQNTYVPGAQHAWYNACFQRFMPTLSPFYAALPSIRNLVFTGSSAGGAIAANFACYYNLGGHPRVRGTYNFGSPRAGNAAFAASIPGYYLALIAEGDFVPALPPAEDSSQLFLGLVANHLLGFNYVDTRLGWQIFANGRTRRGGVIITDAGGAPNPIQYLRLATAWTNGFAKHLIPNYLSILQNLAYEQGGFDQLMFQQFVTINNSFPVQLALVSSAPSPDEDLGDVHTASIVEETLPAVVPQEDPISIS